MGAVTVGPLPPWLDPACGGPSPPSGAYLPWAFPILSGFPEGPARRAPRRDCCLRTEEASPSPAQKVPREKSRESALWQTFLKTF